MTKWRSVLRLAALIAWRDYTSAKGKFILTFIGLVLSISLMTTVSLYVDTVRFSVDQQTQGPAAYPDQYIHHVAGSFSVEDIYELRDSFGIDRFLPFNRHYEQVFLDSSLERVEVVGVDLLAVPPETFQGDAQGFDSDWYQICYMLGPKGMVENIKTVIFDEAECRVRSLVSKALTRPIIVMDIGLYQDLFNPSDSLQRIYPVGNSMSANTNFKQLLHEHPKYRVHNDQGANKEFLASAFFLNLRLVGLLGLVISALLLFKFFRFVFQQREPSMRLLKEFGLPIYQKRGIFVIEGLLFVSCAVVGGLGLGYVISRLGLDILSMTIQLLYYDADFPNIVVSARTVLQSIGIACAMVCIAMSQSVYRAIHSISKPVIFLSLSGLLGIFWTSYSYWIPFVPTQYLGVIMMIALLMVVFLLCIGTVALSSSLIKKGLNERFYALKIAAFHIRRQFVESSVTILAIGLACGLCITMALFITSFRQQVTQWITTSTTADFYVQSPYNTIPKPFPIPNRLVTFLTDHPNVTEIDTISRRRLIIGSNTIMVVTNPFSTLKSSQRLLLDTVMPTFSWTSLDSDTHVFISEAFSRKANLVPGDQLTIQGTVRSKTVQIAAVSRDYATEMGVLIMSEELDQQLFGPRDDYHGISFSVDSNESRQSVYNELVSRFPDLVIQTQTELQAFVLQSFNQTFQLSWLLSILAAAIALFIFVNLISITIRDRFHDYQQLWVLGAGYKTIRHLIINYSLWIGIMSIGVAIVFGYAFGWVLLVVLTPIYFGWAIPMISFDSTVIVMCLLILILSYISAVGFSRWLWKQIVKGESINESMRQYYFTR